MSDAHTAQPSKGATVTTIVHAIGGRSERVSGEVVAYRRRSVVVQTACHGRIVVPLSECEEHLPDAR
jgi:predicted thioesterase